MRMTFGILALVAAAGSASAADTIATATLLSSSAANVATQGTTVVDPSARYSNVTNFSGSAFSHGGAAVQAGNTITRLVADDINMIAALPTVTQITFSVTNLNTVPVVARPRLRFYAADGPAGTPGTLLGGFSFAPISFGANSVNLFFFNPSATANFALPLNFWAAETFDNNTGATGATLAQMNNLGQGIFNPVDVGISGDLAFQTQAAGSFFANLPAGATFNFGGAPAANFGWEIVPAPASMALLGLGGLVIGRRRR